MQNDPNLAPQEQPNDVPVDQLDQTSTQSSDPLLDDTTGINSPLADQTPSEQAVIPPAPMTKPKSKKETRYHYKQYRSWILTATGRRSGTCV